MQYTQRINNLTSGINKLLKTLDFDSKTTEKIKECLHSLETPEIHDLLASIESQIKENKMNLRNIKNEGYIAEIFESHLHDEKSKIKSLIDKKIDSVKIHRNEAKKEMQSVLNKNRELKGEIERMEQEIDKMISLSCKK